MRDYTALILPSLKEFLAQGDERLVRAAVEELLAPDLADIAENLETDEAVRLLTLLPLEQATATLESLDEEVQGDMIERLGRPRLVGMLDRMSPDDRASLMRHLPERSVEMLLPLLAQAERNDVKRLLSYPEETAGALMTTEYVALKADLTADQALAKLRQVAPDSETIYYVYVIDDDRRLQGVLSIRDVICALPGKKLEDLMTAHPVSVKVSEDQEELTRLFEHYDLPVIPVVDDDGHLVGIVTFDDAMDVVQDELTEDVQMLGGTAPLEDSYMRSTMGHIVRRRVFWLILLLFAQSVTAMALAGFESVLHAATWLIPFIPLVNSTGGNSGSQSATLVTRALATGDLELSDAMKVIGREVFSGLLLGCVLAAVGMVVVLALGAGLKPVPIVAASICLAVTIGSVLGTAIPLALHRFGLDPAVASAPFIASLSDVIGITVYLTIAKLAL